VHSLAKKELSTVLEQYEEGRAWWRVWWSQTGFYEDDSGVRELRKNEYGGDDCDPVRDDKMDHVEGGKRRRRLRTVAPPLWN
jgi:hypothetical protein